MNQEKDYKKIIDMRCNGLSLNDIAGELGTSKADIFRRLKAITENGFYGYDPFDENSIRKMLSETDLTSSEIARKFGIPQKGLINYIADREINVREAAYPLIAFFKAQKRTHSWIADYFGVSRSTIESIIDDYELLDSAQEIPITKAQLEHLLKHIKSS